MTQADVSSSFFSGFLSYASKDITLARKLQKALESYRIPKGLVLNPGATRPAGSRLGRFFRDRTDIAASPSLRATILKALAQSNCLIVLCSSATAGDSAWVELEIAEFRRMYPDRAILVAVIGGSPPECFPSSLRTDHPLAADLRPSGDGWKMGLLKLIAGILGVNTDELIRRQIAADRRQTRIRVLALSIYAVILSAALGFAILAYIRARESRGNALADRAREINDLGLHDKALLLSIAALPPAKGAIEKATPSEIAQFRRSLLCNRLRSVRQVHSGTTTIAKHPLKPWIVTAASDGTLQISQLPDVSRLGFATLPGEFITRVAFSPDGTMLAASSGGATGAHVSIWAVDDHGALKSLGSMPLGKAVPNSMVRSVQFAGAGNNLLVGGPDDCARIIDPLQKKVLATSPHHDSMVLDACYSADGKHVLSASYAGTLIEWDAESGNQIGTPGKGGTVTRILPTGADGGWIIGDAVTSIVYTWKPGDSKPEPHHSAGHAANCPLTNRFGGVVASYSQDGEVEFYAPGSFEVAAKLRWEEWITGAVLFDEDRMVATVDRAGRICTWNNPATGIKLNFVSTIGTAGPASAAITDADHFYVLSWDGVLINTKLKRDPLEMKPADLFDKVIFSSEIHRPWSLAVSPDNSKALFGSPDGDLVLHAMDSGASDELVEGVKLRNDRTSFSFVIAFVSNSQCLVATEDNRLLLVDLNTGERKDIALPSKFKPCSLGKDWRSQEVLVGSEDGQVALYRYQSMKLDLWQEKLGAVAMSMAWNARTQTVAVGGSNSMLIAGSFNTKKPHVVIRAGRTRNTWIDSIAISEDGSTVATGTNDGMLQLWDTSSGEKLWEYELGLRRGGAGQWSLVTEQVLFQGTSNETIVASTPDGKFSSFAFPPVPKYPVQALTTTLPIGRESFTGEEMQQMPFLDSSDQEPAKRVGILSPAYWIHLGR